MPEPLGDKAILQMTTVADRPAISGHDQYLFREGTHSRLYEKLGAHLAPGGGVRFAVWAPNARSVAVVGDFNGWDPRAHPMRGSDAGIWEAHIPKAAAGSIYKYHVVSQDGVQRTNKADPFAFRCETPPRTGPVVGGLHHKWGDADWMRNRSRVNPLSQPWSVYDVHLGSWRRHARRVRQAHGVHRRRDAAGDGASVLRLLGLPDHRLLRAELAAGLAAGLHVPGRRAAPGGHRRDPRLGAVALPVGRARAGLLRRHAPLRALGPAPGPPPRLEERDLQLRPQRSARLPRLERAILAGQVPRRRPARGRRRLDAVPRLRPPGRRV